MNGPLNMKGAKGRRCFGNSGNHDISTEKYCNPVMPIRGIKNWDSENIEISLSRYQKNHHPTRFGDSGALSWSLTLNKVRSRPVTNLRWLPFEKFENNQSSLFPVNEWSGIGEWRVRVNFILQRGWHICDRRDASTKYESEILLWKYGREPVNKYEVTRAAIYYVSKLRRSRYFGITNQHPQSSNWGRQLSLEWQWM